MIKLYMSFAHLSPEMNTNTVRNPVIRYAGKLLAL